MDNPYANAGVKPEAALAAAERFFELLKSFGVSGTGQAPNWSSVAAPLAGQFEQWLRLSQSAGPWFAASAAAWPGGAPSNAPGFKTAGFNPASFAAAAFNAPPFDAAGFAATGYTSPAAAAFGPLPLGPSAAGVGGEAQRIFDLWGKLAHLQAQLAGHWSEIANAAAQCFVSRLGSASAAPATPEQALKLYELWVECAEEAYAATVHKDDFARLQSELANTSAALLVEQRRHAESLVRAFGLPTRNEVDALYGQLKELRRQLAGVAAGTASKTTPPRARQGGSPQRARRRRGPGPRA
jgi:Poly(R)-hydroxyalkanoic acid synthase subunit (PHA_synth_III_E)